MNSFIIETQSSELIVIDGINISLAPEVCFCCKPLCLRDDDARDGFDISKFRTVEVRNWMDELEAIEKCVMKDGDCKYEIQ